MIGEHVGISFGIGDSVSVQIARVDVYEQKVDFELLFHDPLRRRARNKPGKTKTSGAGRRRRRRRRCPASFFTGSMRFAVSFARGAENRYGYC